MEQALNLVACNQLIIIITGLIRMLGMCPDAQNIIIHK